jgi:hypothetical protein
MVASVVFVASGRIRCVDIPFLLLGLGVDGFWVHPTFDA